MTATPKLWARLSADVFAATLACCVIALPAAPLELALARSSISKRPLFELVVDALTEPGPILVAALWVWVVYFCTLLSANVSRTLCEINGRDPAIPVWLSSSLVNWLVGCCKDASLGQGSTLATPPSATAAAWALRDVLMCLFVFVLPGPIARACASCGFAGLPGIPTIDVVFVTLPLLLQFLITPLHYFGLSYIVMPGALPWRRRLEASFMHYRARSAVRCIRSLLPCCICPVANRRLLAFFPRLTCWCSSGCPGARHAAAIVQRVLAAALLLAAVTAMHGRRTALAVAAALVVAARARAGLWRRPPPRAPWAQAAV
eukprot:NODE_12908_length_1197_cov_2.556075.p1 GENE.NODE_12908_length_1197_cov_2.556075~~NODE_12908_length_1197_cov_2.556075.p1  ORF type:complete len:352 (-),score=88.11 NODE_12908_length_1197_cov_2.556075:140-1093(-)